MGPSASAPGLAPSMPLSSPIQQNPAKPGSRPQSRITQPFVLIFLLLAPWSVMAINKPVLVAVLLTGLMFWIVKIVQAPALRLDLLSRTVVALYASVFILGLLALLLSVEEIQGHYLSSVIPGRLFTLLAMCVTLILAFDAVNAASSRFLCVALKVALAALGVFILGALWQLGEIWFGIPFPFETRDWMHGVPEAMQRALPRRVTSFAEEPNFLAPLLVEYLILVRFLVHKPLTRNLLLGLGLVIIIFTFSGGAYANLLIMLAVLGFLKFTDVLATYRLQASHLVVGGSLLLVVAYLSVFVFDSVIFEYASAKFTREATGGSSRSTFLVALFHLWLDSEPMRILFGHGLATMSILPNFGMEPAHFLFRISNNFYLDVLWEGGLLGLMLVLTLFFVLLRVGWANRRLNLAYETGLLLSAHLAVTSLYRSEYLSMHFGWMLLVIVCCYSLGARLKKETRHLL